MFGRIITRVWMYSRLALKTRIFLLAPEIKLYFTSIYMFKFCNDISFSCENCYLNFLLAQFKSIIMSISKRRPSKNIRVSFSQEMTENKEDKKENVLTMVIG